MQPGTAVWPGFGLVMILFHFLISFNTTLTLHWPLWHHKADTWFICSNNKSHIFFSNVCQNETWVRHLKDYLMLISWLRAVHCFVLHNGPQSTIYCTVSFIYCCILVIYTDWLAIKFLDRFCRAVLEDTLLSFFFCPNTELIRRFILYIFPMYTLDTRFIWLLRCSLHSCNKFKV